MSQQACSICSALPRWASRSSLKAVRVAASLPGRAIMTVHTWTPNTEVRHMLEEVQMSPSLILRVVRRAVGPAALRTLKLASSGEIDEYVQPLLLGIKRAALNQPRRKKPKRQLKKICVLHSGLLLRDLPYNDNHKSSRLKYPYPLTSAKSQKYPLSSVGVCLN